MGKAELKIEVDEALLAQAAERGLDIPRIVEEALKLALPPPGLAESSAPDFALDKALSDEEKARRWAEENDKAITFDNPTTPEGAMRYWYTRLDYTRNVLKKRPTYFYEMVQERFKLTDEQMLGYFGEKPPLPADAIYTEGKKWS